jgi:hypothetical protein
VPVVVNLDRRVDAQRERHLPARAVGAPDDERRVALRPELVADQDVDRLVAEPR